MWFGRPGRCDIVHPPIIFLLDLQKNYINNFSLPIILEMADRSKASSNSQTLAEFSEFDIVELSAIISNDGFG